MSMSKFNIRNLLAGSSLPAPREDDDAGPAATTGGKPAPVATEAQIEAVLEQETEKAANAAATAATAAANTRWSTVMTSDAGQANPKGASRLLSSTTMAADDVVAMLGDLGPANAAAGQRQQQEQQQGRNATDAAALANDESARPDTGGAASGQASRTGEGTDKKVDMTARRQQRAARRNPANGKQAGGGN
jgi:hypothetical protein